MLSVSTLSELTTQCATRYYGPRTHSPATKGGTSLLSAGLKPFNTADLA